MKKLVTWCEPFLQASRGERNDARTRPDEIPLALAYFKENLKSDATTLYLNRDMIERLGGSFPEGIEIVEHNGVASWEIWAADNNISLSQIVGGQQESAIIKEKKDTIVTVMGQRGGGMSGTAVALAFNDLSGREKVSATHEKKKQVVEIPPSTPDSPLNKEIIHVTPLNRQSHKKGSVKTPLRIVGAKKSKIVSTVTKKPLTKLLTGEKIPKTTDKTTGGALKHGGGRHRKQKDYSERTMYRRKREDKQRAKVGQLVLIK